MKATVMESSNGNSVILTEDGMFRTVKGCYDVGSEFDYKLPLRSNRKLTRRIAIAAACLFMAFSMGGYSYQNLMVYATVTLHGVTPIQLDLNRQDIVIGVRAVEKEGEELAAKLLDSGIKGKYIGDAVASAEQLMNAQAGDKEKKHIKPKVQCKSAAKIKELTDKLTPNTTSTQSGSNKEETTSESKQVTTDVQESESQSVAKPEDSGGSGSEGQSSTGVSTKEDMDPQEVSEDAASQETQEAVTDTNVQDKPEVGVQTVVPDTNAKEPPAEKPKNDAPAEPAEEEENE